MKKKELQVAAALLICLNAVLVIIVRWVEQSKVGYDIIARNVEVHCMAVFAQQTVAVQVMTELE